MKRILILVCMLLGIATVNAQTAAKVNPNETHKRVVQKTLPLRRMSRKKMPKLVDTEVVNGERRKKMASSASASKKKAAPAQESIKKD